MAPTRKKISKRNIAATVRADIVNMPTLSLQTTPNINSQNNFNNNLNSNINPSHNFNTPLIPIQKFDRNTEQVKYFTQQLKQIAESSHWHDAYTLAYAKANLTGKTLKHINEVEETKTIRITGELFNKLL